MVTANEAKRRASLHLAAESAPWAVSRATFNRRFGVWLVSYVDPEKPKEHLVGGGLVVTDDATVHAVGAAPGALEDLVDELTGSFAGDIARAYEREGESLSLLAGIDPGEADGLAWWAASRRATPGSLPASWSAQVASEIQKQHWSDLQSFVTKDRETHDVFPPASETFAAFELTPFNQVRVVILGQTPIPIPDLSPHNGVSASISSATEARSTGLRNSAAADGACEVRGRGAEPATGQGSRVPPALLKADQADTPGSASCCGPATLPRATGGPARALPAAPGRLCRSQERRPLVPELTCLDEHRPRSASYHFRMNDTVSGLRSRIEVGSTTRAMARSRNVSLPSYTETGHRWIEA